MQLMTDLLPHMASFFQNTHGQLFLRLALDILAKKSGRRMESVPRVAKPASCSLLQDTCAGHFHICPALCGGAYDMLSTESIGMQVKSAPSLTETMPLGLGGQPAQGDTKLAHTWQLQVCRLGRPPSWG